MTDPRDFWHILPNYVKKDVVHYLDFKTRCNLSYCSKSDLKLVKSIPIAFRNIIWVIGGDRTSFLFDTLNCPKDRMIAAEFDNTQQIVDRLCSMLRAPNTCKSLLYNSPSNITNNEMIRLTRELDGRNIRPKIKNVKWMHTAGDLLQNFLIRVDAQYLEGIVVNSKCETREKVARIVKTDQWKNLKVVDIQHSLNPLWWLESILEKPMFYINLKKITVEMAHRIINTFQEKNHPVGSCFNVLFYDSDLNVSEIYEDPGERQVDLAENCAYYLKKFPLADEALELRVQLMLILIQPDFDMDIYEISGIVMRKDAEIKYVHVSDIIKNSLYDQ